MAQRTPNCRIFLGNLASERTSPAELKEIFSKYGKVNDDIVLRKSFGFIQFDTPQAALDAIAGENGRLIGGMRLDLNLADNREPRKDAPGRGRGGAPSPRKKSPPRQAGRRRRRSASPSPEDTRDGKRFAHEQQGGLQPRMMLKGPLLCEVFYLGPSQRGYAKKIEEIITRDVGTFTVESRLTERRNVPDELDKAQKKGIRYVCVVGRQNEDGNTVNLHVFRPIGKPETMTGISIRDALSTILQEERKIAQMFGPLLQGGGINLDSFAGGMVGQNPPSSLYGQQQYTPSSGQQYAPSNALQYTPSSSPQFPSSQSQYPSGQQYPASQQFVPSQPQYASSSSQQYASQGLPASTYPSSGPSPLQGIDPSLLSRLISNFGQATQSASASSQSMSASYPSQQVPPAYQSQSGSYSQPQSFSSQGYPSQPQTSGSYGTATTSQRAPQTNYQPSQPSTTSGSMSATGFSSGPQTGVTNVAALLSNPKSTELLQSILAKLNPAAQAQSPTNPPKMTQQFSGPASGSGPTYGYNPMSNGSAPAQQGTGAQQSSLPGNLLSLLQQQQGGARQQTGGQQSMGQPSNYTNPSLDPRSYRP